MKLLSGVLVGRVLMSIIFILSGLYKFITPQMLLAPMKMNGIPASGTLLYASAILELVGGSMLLIGRRTPVAALLLFLWMVPVTLLMHAIPGGQLNRVEVLKNLAIMGGLLVLADSSKYRLTNSSEGNPKI